jgi:hypothetical protein
LPVVLQPLEWYMSNHIAGFGSVTVYVGDSSARKGHQIPARQSLGQRAAAIGKTRKYNFRLKYWILNTLLGCILCQLNPPPRWQPSSANKQVELDRLRGGPQFCTACRMVSTELHNYPQSSTIIHRAPQFFRYTIVPA